MGAEIKKVVFPSEEELGEVRVLAAPTPISGNTPTKRRPSCVRFYIGTKRAMGRWRA
jgi:hypothetical protein